MGTKCGNIPYILGEQGEGEDEEDYPAAVFPEPRIADHDPDMWTPGGARAAEFGGCKTPFIRHF